MNNRRTLLWLGLLVLLLAYVNPELKDFHAYVQKKVASAGNSSDKLMENFVAGVSENALKAAQEQGAVRKNYLIFSIFEIENPTDHKTHRVLGFAKSVFIPLNEAPPEWKEIKVD